ncbi:MAG TPA: hypothetical protein VFZ25_21220, partial [Chloroflexota bacterium]|nr:hypothetical protein [Chloroflexota bacterium]
GVFGKLHWFDGRSALPLPPPGSGPTLYVLPSSAADPSWYQTLPASTRTSFIKGPDGAPAVEAFVLRPDDSVAEGTALASPLHFGNLATLVAADFPRAMQPGLTIAPLLTWRLDRRPSEPVKFFAHLVDASGQRWTQYDEEVYPTSDWQPGQLLLVRRPIRLPGYLPPGRYTLEVGIESADGTPFGAVDPAGRALGSFWRSPVVEAIRPERPPGLSDLKLGQPMNVAFGGVARLIGVNETTSRVQDGDTVALTLTWQVLAPSKGNLTTVIGGIDAAGQPIGETAAPPTGGVWPATEWQAGDIVVDHQQYLVPAGTPSGPLTLAVGLRDAAGRPLAPSANGPGGLPLVAVGNVNVTARPHTPTEVTFSHVQPVSFVGGIQLLGYDLSSSTARPGQPLQLRLVWRADQPQATSYTVFTHLLDDHDKIWAQHDGLPANATRPTTTWEPGETIADLHLLPIQPDAPPGAYRLEVGLYDARTGARLSTTAGADRVLLEVPVTVAR